jgi:hypothetical protein
VSESTNVFKPIKGYYVILTYPRSGGTLLQRIIDADPNVTMRGDNISAVKSIVEAYRSLKQAKEVLPPIFDSDPTWSGSPFYGSHLYRMEYLRISLARSIVDGILVPEAGSSHVGFRDNWFDPTVAKPHVVEDLLTNLEELLPGVTFLINVRDPEETSRSAIWNNDPGSKAKIQQWREWLLHLHNDKIVQRSHLLDYDKYKDDPAYLTSVLASAGIHVKPLVVASLMTERLTHLQNF